MGITSNQFYATSNQFMQRWRFFCAVAMLGASCQEISFVINPGNVMRWPKCIAQSSVDLAGIPSEAW